MFKFKKRKPMKVWHHVVFAMPSSNFVQCLEGRDAAIMTDRLLIEAGIGASYIGLGGDCYLSKARSKLATKFLEDYPTAETLFFIDDDIGWPAHKALEFILRPEDVLAGVYPKKSDTEEWPCVLRGDAETGRPIISEGLVAAEMVPTGFLRIKRHVIQKIADNSRKFYTVDDRDITQRRLYHEIFKMGVDKDFGDWVGEDPWFCREWRAMGGDLWIDPDIQFTHRGSKKWTNTLASSLDGFTAQIITGKSDE